MPLKEKDEFYKKELFILCINDISLSLISKALNNLIEYKLLEEIDTRPKEYKLIWTKEIINNIDKLLDE